MYLYYLVSIIEKYSFWTFRVTYSLKLDYDDQSPIIKSILSVRDFQMFCSIFLRVGLTLHNY